MKRAARAYTERTVRRFASAVVLFVLALSGQPGAARLDPQGVVRRFCQADGLGKRVTIEGWPEVAPLVDWRFEPAWDHAVLISGYEVGTPRTADDGTVEVDVRYGVVSQVSASGMDSAVQIETLGIRLKVLDGDWRIVGPPFAPHLFASRVDIERMRRSLEEGGVNFVSNTRFVWQMFRSAGWEVEYQTTADLFSGTMYRSVDQPRAGDLVVYLREDAPYHVGLLEEENRVVSSTINAGIVRTTLDAFPGEVKYLRLLEPEPAPNRAAPWPPPTAQPQPTPAARTEVKASATATKPALRSTPMQYSKTPRHSAKHSVRHRVKDDSGPARPSPVATRERR